MLKSLCTSFSCDSMSCSGCSALCGVKPNLKKGVSNIDVQDFSQQGEVPPIDQNFDKPSVKNILSLNKCPPPRSLPHANISVSSLQIEHKKNQHLLTFNIQQPVVTIVEMLTPVKVQTNCNTGIFMYQVFSTITSKDFIHTCILIFQKPIPLPQLYCLLLLKPPQYLLTASPWWGNSP